MSKKDHEFLFASSCTGLAARVARRARMGGALLGMLASSLAGASATHTSASAAAKAASQPLVTLASFAPQTLHGSARRLTESSNVDATIIPAAFYRTAHYTHTDRFHGASHRHGATRVSHERAATCSVCGVVEWVGPVKQNGEGTGLGAVTGGVLGAVVGNQVGGGNGRKAMAVLGAVGGGFAGNEVESRLRGHTVYSVRVRMNDGTTRWLQREQPPAVGSRVVLNGNTS